MKVEREFEGLRHCLAHVYKVDGMAGWYRGINMACLGIFIYRAMYFGMFDNLKRLWSKKSVVENKEKRTKIPVTLSLVIAQVPNFPKRPLLVILLTKSINMFGSSNIRSNTNNYNYFFV